MTAAEAKLLKERMNSVLDAAERYGKQAEQLEKTRGTIEEYARKAGETNDMLAEVVRKAREVIEAADGIAGSQVKAVDDAVARQAKTVEDALAKAYGSLDRKITESAAMIAGSAERAAGAAGRAASESVAESDSNRMRDIGALTERLNNLSAGQKDLAEQLRALARDREEQKKKTDALIASANEAPAIVRKTVKGLKIVAVVCAALVVAAAVVMLIIK